MNSSFGLFDPATDPTTAEAFAKRMSQNTEKSSPAASPTQPDGEEPLFPPLRPLPTIKLDPVLPYREDMLPQALRPWIADVAERGQFHFDFLAVAAMAALGSALGRRCAVYPKQKDDWAEYPNLWAALIGRPGAMKSPALNETLAPLHTIQAKWAEEFHLAQSAYETARLRAKIERDARIAKAKDAAKKRKLVRFARGE